MDPIILSSLITGGAGLLGRLTQKKPRKFSYPGMEGDLKLAGVARGKIWQALEGTRPLSDATVQSNLDRVTGREFDAAEGREQRRRAALGLAGPTGDVERQAQITRARSEAIGGNVLQAQAGGLRSRLDTVRMLQGLTAVGPEIGRGQLGLDQLAAEENAGLSGAMGGAAGLISGGIMDDAYLSRLEKILRRRGGGSATTSGPIGFIPPVVG